MKGESGIVTGVLGFVLGFVLAGGCSDTYRVTKGFYDSIYKNKVEVAITVSDRNMDWYRLLKEKKYVEAEKSIKTYLENRIPKYKDYLDSIVKDKDLSNGARVEINEKLDGQAKKIMDCLKKYKE